MSEENKYWFPAKRYGWGWGIPISWQGWVVLAIFISLMVIGAWLLLPMRNVRLYVAYVLILTTLLVAICWLKGEPPRWRWGK